MLQKSDDPELTRNSRHNDIINASIRCFSTIPFAEVSLSAIAREAKCSHSLIYHYYKNINLLYEAALETILTSFEKLLSYTLNPQDVPEIKFVGVISYIIRLLKTDEMFPFYIQTLLLESVLSKHNKRKSALLLKWIEQMSLLIKAGQIRQKIIQTDSGDLILHISYMIRGMVNRVIIEPTSREKLPAASTIYLSFLREA